MPRLFVGHRLVNRHEPETTRRAKNLRRARNGPRRPLDIRRPPANPYIAAPESTARMGCEAEMTGFSTILTNGKVVGATMKPQVDAPTLIAVLSEGDTLERLGLVTVFASYDDLRPEVRDRLHLRLRSLGMGHSFFKGKLWLAPLDGGSFESCVEKVAPFFAGPVPDPKKAEVDSADNVDWNGVVKLLVRDAVAHALFTKGETNRDLLPRGSMIFDLGEQLPGPHSGFTVVPGLDLGRVYRATGHRVVVTCPVEFRAFDANNERPANRAAATAALTKANAHGADVRWGFAERISQKVLPMPVSLADRKFSLTRMGIPIPDRGGGAKPWF